MIGVCAPIESIVFHVLQDVVSVDELIVTMLVKRIGTTCKKMLTTETYLKHLIDN